MLEHVQRRVTKMIQGLECLSNKELKTWGLMLEALKAAKEEGTVTGAAWQLLGLAPAGAGTGFASTAGGGAEGGPGESQQGAGAPRDNGQTGAGEEVGSVVACRCSNGAIRVASAIPTTLSGGGQDGDSHMAHPPPPYPDRSTRPTYPFTELRAHTTNQGPTNQGPPQQIVSHKTKLDRGEAGGRGELQNLQLPGVPEEDSEGEGEVNLHWGAKRGELTDWGKIRSTLIEEGRVLETFPVVVNSGGNPEWVPLDPKGITRLLDCAEKRGLNSPLTLNALEAMTSLGPLLPYDITNLMHVVLTPVQYTLWSSEWMAGLRAALGAAESNPHHPLHGSSLMHLAGMARGMETPHGQAGRLRPGELIAATDAMLQAFRRIAKGTESVDLWTKVTQGPTESFSEFANRLLKAIQGSELPRSAQGPVIMDCLQQQCQQEIRDLTDGASLRYSGGND